MGPFFFRCAFGFRVNPTHVYHLTSPSSPPLNQQTSVTSPVAPTHECLAGQYLSPYKTLFHFKALLWESIILLLPPHHLQSLPYCNTIARLLRNIRPPTDLAFVCRTPYNIGDGNIVERPTGTGRSRSATEETGRLDGGGTRCQTLYFTRLTLLESRVVLGLTQYRPETKRYRKNGLVKRRRDIRCSTSRKQRNKALTLAHAQTIHYTSN